MYRTQKHLRENSVSPRCDHGSLEKLRFSLPQPERPVQRPHNDMLAKMASCWI